MRFADGMNAASRSHRVHLRAVSQALQDEAFPTGKTNTVKLHVFRYVWTAKHVQQASPVQTARLFRKCLPTYISELKVRHPAHRRLDRNRNNE